MHAIDALFQPLADVLGASVDQIKLISCLLFSYPLGSVFVHLPGPTSKHLFSIAVTFFYVGVVLDLWSGLAQLLVSILGTYFIAQNVKSKSMPWIVFWFVMGHLTLNHAIRAIFNWSYETFEVTGPQMVLTMKLTTFAWNVYDGRRPLAGLDKWQSEKRVVQYPSLLAFLGYSFYFPGFLVGPFIDFASYASLIDETLFRSVSGKNVDLNGRRVPRGRKRVGYLKMLIGLAFLGAFVTMIGTYSFEAALQPWFTEMPLLKRLVIFQVCGYFERTKYYAIWTLTEGASIITGYGFSGFGSRGQSLWHDAANVDVLNIEFAPNFKVLLDSWNMKTNVWLRECVYKRVTPPGKKPGFRSSMITFATSAFWHGIAGGYYLTFLYGGFVQTAGRLARSHFRPLVLPPTFNPRSKEAPPRTFFKMIYDILGIVCAVSAMNYAAMPFMLLGIQRSFEGWSHVAWYGFVMVGGALAFFNLGGAALLSGIQKGRVKRAEGGKARKDVAEAKTPTTPGPMIIPPVDLALEVDKKL